MFTQGVTRDIRHCPFYRGHERETHWTAAELWQGKRRNGRGWARLKYIADTACRLLWNVIYEHTVLSTLFRHISITFDIRGKTIIYDSLCEFNSNYFRLPHIFFFNFNRIFLFLEIITSFRSKRLSTKGSIVQYAFVIFLAIAKTQSVSRTSEYFFRGIARAAKSQNGRIQTALRRNTLVNGLVAVDRKRKVVEGVSPTCFARESVTLEENSDRGLVLPLNGRIYPLSSILNFYKFLY